MVFDHAWFDRHQRSLCAVLNTPGLGHDARAVLGIDQGERVVRVLPHAVIVAPEPTVRVATFRSRPFVARRLYLNFLPVWQLCHWFDMRVANPWVPALNLGFDTLTRYPDAHPETDTVDGYTGRSGVDETFPTIIAAGGLIGDDAEASTFINYLSGSVTSDQFSQLRRGIFLFNTAAIGAGSVVSAATFSVWGIGKRNAIGSSDFVLVASTPTTNTAVGWPDYGFLGSTSFGAITHANFDATDTVYSNLTINGSGITDINITGITKYGSKFEWDRAGTFSGSWSADSSYYQINMAENASGTAKAPKLVVTYTPVSLQVLLGEPTVGGSVF
jgi:hypothetical protein